MSIYEIDPDYVEEIPEMSFGNTIERGGNQGSTDYFATVRGDAAKYRASDAEQAAFNDYVSNREKYGENAPYVNSLDQFVSMLDYNESKYGQRAIVQNPEDEADGFYDYLRANQPSQLGGTGPGGIYQRNNTVIGKRTNGTSSGASDLYAKINREQYEDFKERFAPRERELIGVINSKENIAAAAGLRAANDVDSSYEQAAGITERNAMRYGLSMDPRNKKEYDKQISNDKALSKTHAYNQVSTAERDRLTGVSQDMIAVGRGLQADASSGAKQSASMAASRDSANESISAQKKAQKNAAIGTAIGIGLSML